MKTLTSKTHSEVKKALFREKDLFTKDDLIVSAIRDIIDAFQEEIWVLNAQDDRLKSVSSELNDGVSQVSKFIVDKVFLYLDGQYSKTKIMDHCLKVLEENKDQNLFHYNLLHNLNFGDEYAEHLKMLRHTETVKSFVKSSKLAESLDQFIFGFQSKNAPRPKFINDIEGLPTNFLDASLTRFRSSYSRASNPLQIELWIIDEIKYLDIAELVSMNVVTRNSVQSALTLSEEIFTISSISDLDELPSNVTCIDMSLLFKDTPQVKIKDQIRSIKQEILSRDISRDIIMFAELLVNNICFAIDFDNKKEELKKIIGANGLRPDFMNMHKILVQASAIRHKNMSTLVTDIFYPSDEVRTLIDEIPKISTKDIQEEIFRIMEHSFLAGSNNKWEFYQSIITNYLKGISRELLLSKEIQNPYVNLFILASLRRVDGLMNYMDKADRLVGVIGFFELVIEEFNFIRSHLVRDGEVLETDEVLKKLVNHTSLQRCYLRPYCSTGISDILSSLVSSYKDSLKVFLAEDSYYELRDNKYSNLNVSIGDISVEVKKTYDVLLFDILPNEVTRDKVTKHDYKEIIVRHLRGVTNEHPLTVIIDSTTVFPSLQNIDFISDSDIGLAIKEGKICVVQASSLAKFAQFGMDSCSGGLLRVINNDSGIFKIFNANLENKVKDNPLSDEATRNFYFIFHYCNQSLLEYENIIKRNTEYLYQGLRKLGFQDTRDSMFYLQERHSEIPMIGIQFLAVDDMRTNNPSCDVKANLSCLVHFYFVYYCQKDGLNPTSRYSWGFNGVSINDCYTALRITVGLESNEVLDKYAKHLSNIRDELNQCRNEKVFQEVVDRPDSYWFEFFEKHPECLDIFKKCHSFKDALGELHIKMNEAATKTSGDLSSDPRTDGLLASKLDSEKEVIVVSV